MQIVYQQWQTIRRIIVLTVLIIITINGIKIATLQQRENK